MMNVKEKVLTLAVKKPHFNYDAMKKELVREGVELNPYVVKEILAEFNLNKAEDRLETNWNLNLLAESVFLKAPDISNDKLTEAVTEIWETDKNKDKNLSKKLVEAALESSRLTSEDDRKNLYKFVSEGFLDPNYLRRIVYMIARYIILKVDRVDINHLVVSIELLLRDWGLDNERLSKTVADGLRWGCVQKDDNIKLYKKLYNGQDFAQINALEKLVGNQGTRIISYILPGNGQRHEGMFVQSSDGDAGCKQENERLRETEQELESIKTEIASLYKKIFIKKQDSEVLDADQIEALKKENEEIKRFLEEVKMTNQRLLYSLEDEKKRADVLKERAVVNFLKHFVGNQSGYILTNLYEMLEQTEMDMDSLKGTVSNLFSELKMLGLVPTFGGYKLGQEIIINRSDLGNKFLFKDSVYSTCDKMMVKIVGCGWDYDRQTVIPPLVKKIRDIHSK